MAPEDARGFAAIILTNLAHNSAEPGHGIGLDELTAAVAPVLAAMDEHTLTARYCVEQAADCLDQALAHATIPADPAAHPAALMLGAAQEWRELATAIATHRDMQPDDTEGPTR